MYPIEIYTSLVEPPASIRVPRQWLLAPSVKSITLSDNYKGDNEVKPGTVHRSPCIYPGKTQLKVHRMKVVR